MKKSIKLLSVLLLGSILSTPVLSLTPKLTEEQTQDPYVLMELFGAAYSVIKTGMWIQLAEHTIDGIFN